MSHIILIADDEPGIVAPLQFLMEQAGYEVLIAYHGEKALDMILDRKPDLILLDIMLPGIDGFDICQHVRSRPDMRKIKIIMITAMGREVNVAKGMALGADAYIIKPFSNRDIVEKVARLLETSHASEQ
jgi:DNA-binding response OmpR family regulator